jgi:hypothetical protein
MRILVTGGYGCLGYHLIKHLVEENNDVGIIDIVEDWNFDIENKPKVEYLGNSQAIKTEFRKFKPHCVVHCAEHTQPDISLAENTTFTNIAMTTTIIHTCASNGIACIVPAWEEITRIIMKDFWMKSVEWRAEIGSKFNLGNGVNCSVYLPRIISPYTNETEYGAVVNRVYNSIKYGGYCFIYNQELEYTASWCSPENAINEIMKKISTRSREDIIYRGNIVSANAIIGYILDKMEVENIETFDVKGKSNLLEKNSLLKDYSHALKGKAFFEIKKSIDEVING